LNIQGETYKEEHTRRVQITLNIQGEFNSDRVKISQIMILLKSQYEFQEVFIALLIWILLRVGEMMILID